MWPRNFNGVGTLSDAGRWSTSSVVIRGSDKYSLILAVYSASAFFWTRPDAPVRPGEFPSPRARWRRQSRQRVRYGDSSGVLLGHERRRFIAHFPQRSAPGAHADPGRAGGQRAEAGRSYFGRDGGRLEGLRIERGSRRFSPSRVVADRGHRHAFGGA